MRLLTTIALLLILPFQLQAAWWGHVVSISGVVADFGTTRMCLNVGCREGNSRSGQNWQGQLRSSLIAASISESVGLLATHYGHPRIANGMLIGNGGLFWYTAAQNLSNRQRQLQINRAVDSYKPFEFIPLVPVLPCGFCAPTPTVVGTN